MSDRELLELAAKAVGYELRVNLANAYQLWKDGEYVRFWNPLEDDGDALRLAVQLGMEIDAGRTSSCAFRGHIGKRVAEEAVGEDRFAATRRVIVRLAAGIGESIP